MWFCKQVERQPGKQALRQERKGARPERKGKSEMERKTDRQSESHRDIKMVRGSEDKDREK